MYNIPAIQPEMESLNFYVKKMWLKFQLSESWLFSNNLEKLLNSGSAVISDY
jgi:hypothetical protein